MTDLVRKTASSTVGGELTNGTQTIAGAKTFSGGLVGNTSGAAMTAGLIGEMIGTVRAGTGGNSYSVRSTTAVGLVTTKVISQALNKGVYLVSIKVNSTSTVATHLRLSGGIGGTIVTTESFSYNSTTSVQRSMTITFPAVITTDATEVQGWSNWDGGTISNNDHEMSIIRIA